ncbi:MAG: hypothetical protein RLZZ210_459 [Pseudomonadota bacterium]|jgi:uncharacterized lipoprotein
MDNVVKINEASDVKVSVTVKDKRPDTSRKVSAKKNGYGMEMADIIANEDVSIIITKAIEEELIARGFTISDKDMLVNIVADVTRFYNDHKLGFFSGDAIADLNMSVVIKNKSNQIIYNKQIACRGIEEHTQLATGKNAKLALEKALQNGMKILFQDEKFISSIIESKK